MKKIDENTMRKMIFEILNMERKNLRSKAKTDQQMAVEISKVVSEYAKLI